MRNPATEENNGQSEDDDSAKSLPIFEDKVSNRLSPSDCDTTIPIKHRSRKTPSLSFSLPMLGGMFRHSKEVDSTPMSTSTSASTTPQQQKVKQRQNSTSFPRKSPPPDFLLDDDPFANLTGGRQSTGLPTTSRSTPTSPSQRTFSGSAIRSSFPSIAFSSTPYPSSSTKPLQPPISPPAIPRSPSFPHSHRPSPAYQRPAFKSRPSLPSLHTLAKINFTPGTVKKVRKGKVGAGLPLEPWNDLDSRRYSSSGETSPILMGERAGVLIGSPDESGGEPLPPVPPLPTSTSISDYNPNQVPMSSPLPLAHSFSPITSSSSSSSSTKLRSPSRSPLPSQSPGLEGNGIPASTDKNSAVDIHSAVELDLTHGLDASSIPKEIADDPDCVSYPRHDDVYMEGDGQSYNDDDDEDGFMDHFMDHYDREEDQPLAPTATVTSLIEMPLAVSVPASRTSATSTPAFSDSIAVDTSNAILAPTLRTRTRTTRMATTASVNMDSEADDSSLFDSYLYTYPYPLASRQNGVESGRPSFSFASVSVSARGSRWSPSQSVSRSRSLSSTYTSLSFGSESESSSYAQSSLEGDDDKAPTIMKSSEEAVLRTDVSVLGSPPPLSMPFSGIEDIDYCVPVSGASSILPVHHGIRKDFATGDDNTQINVSTAGIATSYFNNHAHGDGDVSVGDRAGQGFNSRKGSRHSVFPELGVSAVEVDQFEEGGVESEALSELVAEVKTDLEESDVEVEVEHEVEWEYVVGAGSFVGANNGVGGPPNVTPGHEPGGRQAEKAIAMVTPDAISELVNDMNLITPTTSLATPTMTQFISTRDALSSSTTVAAALALSTRAQDASELVEPMEGSSASTEGNGNGGGHSSTYKSGGALHHANHGVPSSPYEWKQRGGRDDENDDEKRRGRRAALERGGRKDPQSSFLTISPGSTSLPGDDDDHYGLASSSPSQLGMNVNPRTPPSRTHSSRVTPSSPYPSASTRFPTASGSRGSSAGESEFSDDDEEDEEEEAEEDPQQANNAQEKNDEDDDIPLAQRIPGALTAQKSIRHQVRREKEQKKQEKVLRGRVETARTRLATLRPAGAVPSGSHDAALLAASASQSTMHLEQQQQTRRQRAYTVTGKGSMSGNSFSPENLAKKLRDINVRDGAVEAVSISSSIGATALYQQQQQQQQREHSRHRSQSVSQSSRDFHPAEASPPPIPHIGSAAISHAQRTKSVKEPSSSYHYQPSPSPSPVISPHVPSSMTTLRPMRSFHRSSTERQPAGMDDRRSAPLLSDAEQRVSRSSTSVTRSQLSTRDGPQGTYTLSSTPVSTHHHRSLSQSRSSIDRVPATIPEPVPPIPTAPISHDEHRKILKPHHYKSPSSSRVGSTRISVDAERPMRMSSHQHRPALPSTSFPIDPLLAANKPMVVQQRVFVGDMQRFKMVEIGTSTTAGDVIEMIEAEGSLGDFVGSGGWMVFEVSQDFGMERPIRSFELVTDVQASWNKDKMVNYLVLKLTPMAISLNRSAIPSSSPTHSGYVEWEVKRGKWSKRWMQLREHSIWLSKRDQGRDEVQLCSLSTFDAYQVTRSHRAPKPFSFAVKSTDNLSFFENTADYLHSFACSEKDGKVWMEKILVARSYVLFQERHVLFSSKAVNSNPSSRSGTRKATTQRPAAHPPLVPFTGAQSHHDVFEPGSLLSKQF